MAETEDAITAALLSGTAAYERINIVEQLGHPNKHLAALRARCFAQAGLQGFAMLDYIVCQHFWSPWWSRAIGLAWPRNTASDRSPELSHRW